MFEDITARDLFDWIWAGITIFGMIYVLVAPGGLIRPLPEDKRRRQDRDSGLGV